MDHDPERLGREGDTQPMPKVAIGPIMHEVVIDELRRRLEVGVRRYGQPLRAFNGRDAAQDAFEEVLDLSVYLAQVRIEMETLRIMLSEFCHAVATADEECPAVFNDLYFKAQRLL